ncbi:hypothetical protein F511_22897 [Dorcoceras hygrometricum]|uniref:Uncharacterized protein n=1 Tax=Dorcoceras hygrometricum TaxID=472368 RepID=A0A2Z7BZJ3_9LAMI|nr:hypothetical protein F511_22897 [Dorcoceras hygrometricum]
MSGIKANDSDGNSNLRNHRNPKHSDSAGNHDSVKAFGFSGTMTQPVNQVSMIISNPKHGDSAGKSWLNDYSVSKEFRFNMNACNQCQ